MTKAIIAKQIERITGAKNVQIEVPEIENFGDYSTNVSMHLAKKKQKDPKRLGEEIAEKLKKNKELKKIVKRIEVAGPGFINFYLSDNNLKKNVEQILIEMNDYGRSNRLKNKKYLLEHTSPNTIKTLHIGHIRNNVLAMAVHNLLEFVGSDVKLDSINNDRGIHVMKAVWAYLKYGKGKTPESEKMKSDTFVDKYYVIGAKAAKNNKNIDEMQELLRRWESGDEEIVSVWKKLRDWTFDGFKQTYERLGSHHDKQWFESEFWKKGKEEVEKGLKKKVFKKLDDGAVLTQLSEYNLPDTIVLRSDGTSMYHTQDLYLTRLKRKEFPADKYFWDISKDQILYLKQLFAMLEQLGIGKREDYFHLVYGYINLKGKGKMSSRSGDVVSADWLLDEMVKKAGQINKDVSEVVGIGAIKYAFLKLSRERDIDFDIDESLSLEGNNGPYLQYTYARTQSVLRKSQISNSKLQVNIESQTKSYELLREERSLLRLLIHFPETVEISALNYSPNLMCNYLFDLAQKYNTFYNTCRILDAKKERDLRLAQTVATGQILKNGLTLLGIEVPDRM